MADSNPAPPASKLRTFLRRSFSTVSLWVVVGGALASQQAWAYLALIALLSLVGTLEYFRMLRYAGVPCYPKFGILLTLGYSIAFACYFLNPTRLASGHSEILPAEIDGIALFLAAAGSFTLQLRQPIRGLDSLQPIAYNTLGFVYVSFLFHFAAKLIFLVPGPGQVPGALLLLLCLVVTKFTDMGAYLVGTLIGRHKMIPHVSPGKTWEGFVGALFIAVGSAFALYHFFPAPHQLGLLKGWHHVAILGLLLALLAVVGDLAESILKRALGAKDSGQMLPGIGGALDLIDSLCFTAPVLYFYAKWVMN